MELYDRADVVRVLLSKVGVDLVVNRLEFARELRELLLGKPVQRVAVGRRRGDAVARMDRHRSLLMRRS